MADDIPPPPSPPQPPAQGARSKRRALMIAGGIVAVLAITAAIITGVVFLLRDSAEQSVTQTGGDLPSAEQRQPAGETGIPPASPTPGTDTSPTPTIPPPAQRQERESLAITISYQQAAEFDLAVDHIARTYEVPTIDFQQPAAQQPYSVLEIYAVSGEKIDEHRFSMPTAVALEGLDEDDVNNQYAIPQSQLDLVVPVPEDTIPGEVRIVTSHGQTLDERSFIYLELPHDVPQPTPEPLSFWHQVRQLWRGAATHAATPIKIVVINEVGASGNLSSTQASAQDMIQGIEPWTTYSNDLTVVPIQNSIDLGCTPITLSNGKQYPSCPNSGSVIREVQKRVPDWGAIIVVDDFNCNCGTAYFGSHITAVGYHASDGLIAHEFGHAIASMADEYYYQFNGNGNAGPNCFNAKTTCEAALQPYQNNPDAICSPGCNNVNTFRPANLLMHNNYRQLRFGPLEECIMGHKVAALVGKSHNCPQPPTPAPRPPQPLPSGVYWGGGR